VNRRTASPACVVPKTSPSFIAVPEMSFPDPWI